MKIYKIYDVSLLGCLSFVKIAVIKKFTCSKFFFFFLLLFALASF